jgi:peptidoglycan/LPS O-acetylase OafA/YrhL
MRVPALDGVRGVAILAVVLFHTNLLADSHVPLDEAVGKVLGFGWMGVDVFFVLSGFLITGILIDTRREAGYFTKFYARRALRIVPAYYALLAVLFFVVPDIIAYPPLWIDKFVGAQAWYWTYLTNWWLASSNGQTVFNTGHLWSLAIEEQFYLVWPVVVWITTRKSTRVLRRICLAIVVASPVLRWLLLNNGVSPYTTYLLTFTRLDGLAAGAWLACAARENSKGLQRYRLIAPWSAAAGAAGIVGLAVIYGSASVFSTGMLVVGLSLVSVVAVSVVTLACAEMPRTLATSWLEQPALVSIGKYSYAMYLVHYPLIFFLRRDGARILAAVPELGMSFILPQAVLIGATLASTYIVARLSWLAIEAPVLRLKRTVPYEWDARAAKATSVPSARERASRSGELRRKK